MRKFMVCATLAATLVLSACGGEEESANAEAPPTSPSPSPSPTPPANTPPTITGSPGVTIQAGQAYSFKATGADADGDTLGYAVTGNPAWTSFDAASGTLAGTPADANVGTSGNIVISVSDGRGGSAALPAFQITVTARPPTTPPTPGNTPPTISGAPAASATVGTAYSFQPSASDANGDTLTFSISNRPSWASFNPANGRLSGTPGSSNVGTTSNILISVSDGKGGSASLPAFLIRVVAAANRPPTITGSPGTSVQAGTAYSFQPSASDPDGNTLSYSIVNLPSWASFSTSTGRLTGTPAAANVGSTSGIVISVSDGRGGSASLPAFSLAVTSAPNRAPTITGTPTTAATVGTAYSFRPTGADADGDTLTYSISNKPAWASFNTTNGTLGGTPAEADAGSYANIVIGVSDGKATTNLAAFTITVSTAATGNATLTWTAPTQREDGTALTAISGYRIYYGRTSGSLTTSVNVSSGLTTYVVENLAAGTWFFAMTTLDSAGLESARTSEVSKSF